MRAPGLPRPDAANVEVRHPAAFTIDVEPDCPPYLWTFRGMEEGMPRLLDLMAGERVRGTFFTTADVARRYPSIVSRIVADGHELASHGVTHRGFDTMSPAEAEREVAESVETLSAHAPITAFRAPYLRMPEAYVPMLREHGITIDCSVARYKRRRGATVPGAGVRRIAASVTSSVLRAPDALRWPYMRAMGWPLVLFVHPWEFVDLRHEPLRWDCRFRTGDQALQSVKETFAHVRGRGGEFLTIGELAARQ